MNNGHKIAQPIWGILGGMGPLASAEFLTSIYKLSLGRTEQNMPRLYLVSDPTVPDRTKAILNCEYDSSMQLSQVSITVLSELVKSFAL